MSGTDTGHPEVKVDKHAFIKEQLENLGMTQTQTDGKTLMSSGGRAMQVMFDGFRALERGVEEFCCIGIGRHCRLSINAAGTPVVVSIPGNVDCLDLDLLFLSFPFPYLLE